MRDSFNGLTTYEQVAGAVGLDDTTARRFVAFMRIRFSNDDGFRCLTGYAQEWAEFFKCKDEYNHADCISQSVLMKIDS